MSFKMVTKLHNRSKQSHFPARINKMSLCLLSIIGQSSEDCQLIRTGIRFVSLNMWQLEFIINPF